MVQINKALTAMDKSGSYRVYLAVTTPLAETGRKYHDPTPTGTAALSRVLTGAALMGIMTKNDRDKITVQFKGDGPAREILATSYGTGKVKGYISNPDIDLPLKADGTLPVGDSIGIGTITVIRDFGLKEPYMGRIDLVSGEIADDLTAYFFISEQMPSSVILGEKIAEDGSVAAAAGMVIQMLPGAKTEAIDALEALLKDSPNIALLLEECEKAITEESGVLFTPEAYVQRVLDEMFARYFAPIDPDYAPEFLEYRDLGWECDCSRARLEQVLLSLGENDLRELAEEDGGAELVCQFCRSKYQFTKEELLQLLQEGR